MTSDEPAPVKRHEVSPELAAICAAEVAQAPPIPPARRQELRALLSPPASTRTNGETAA